MNWIKKADAKISNWVCNKLCSYIDIALENSDSDDLDEIYEADYKYLRRLQKGRQERLYMKTYWLRDIIYLADSIFSVRYVITDWFLVKICKFD